MSRTQNAEIEPLNNPWMGQMQPEQLSVPEDVPLAIPPYPTDADGLVWDVLESPAPEGALLPEGFEARAVRA